MIAAATLPKSTPNPTPSIVKDPRHLPPPPGKERAWANQALAQMRGSVHAVWCGAFSVVFSERHGRMFVRVTDRETGRGCEIDTEQPPSAESLTAWLRKAALVAN